jgi:rhodanese-related sulfurtransferase
MTPPNASRSCVLRWGRCIEVASNYAFALVEGVRHALGKPAVQRISIADLQAALASNDPKVVLVDVRSEQERGVSRIPGAIALHEFLNDKDMYNDALVVPYCTIGGRSYLQAARLANQGMNVKNLAEGIVGWCRAGLPLETPDNQPTNKVHTHWRLFAIPPAYEFSKTRD